MTERSFRILKGCQSVLIGIAVLGFQLSGADARQAAPRSQQDICSVLFPNFIDVTLCNGGVSLQWSSQNINVDHITGDFDTNWAPNEPNVLNVKGHLDATTFSANLKCPSGTGPTGTITATGTNYSYTGTYTLGANTGPVTITVNRNGGGGGNDNPIVSATLTPNPAKVGDTVVFKGTITPQNHHVVTVDDRATITFGDGSPPQIYTGVDFLPLFKTTGISHQYMTAGVFNVNLYLDNVNDAPGDGDSLDFFEVVGDVSVSVDGSTGVHVISQVDSGGTASLQIDATKIPDVTNAETTFEDPYMPIVGLRAAAPRVSGFNPSKSFTTAGLFRATSNLTNASATQIGTIRKTGGISDKQAGDPNGLGNPMSTGIVVKSLKGKVNFTMLTKKDDIVLTGQFLVPPSFTTGRSGADEFQIGIGNVIDILHLDSKGNAKGGIRSVAKKASIKIPKLPVGGATGNESAKITVELNATNLAGAGLDTEGITMKRGANETGIKTLTRFIQVNMVFAGVPYESLIPVNYTMSAKGDTGSFMKKP